MNTTMKTREQIAIEKLRDENDALTAQLARQWRDIATAPKDGTRILVVNVHLPQIMHIARWIGEPHNFWQEGGAHPTHWQPLPSAP